MSLQIDIGRLIATLLVSVRVASAMAFVPVFGPAQIPAPAKVLLTMGLGALMIAVVPSAPAYIDSITGLTVAVFYEAITGASFALGFLVAYAATQIAGRALDVQIGFGAASILNPAAPGLSPLLGSLFGMVMVAVFMVMDGHHLLFRALSTSLATMPPGQADSLQTGDLSLAILQSGTMFTVALALAAPVMFALWLSDVAMAVFARSMPQLNVFVLSFAVKIMMGMVGLALSIGLTRSLFDDLFNSTFRYWDRLAGPG